MANNLEKFQNSPKEQEFQTSPKEQLEAATTLSSSFVESLQTIAAETTEYSKKSLENGSAFVEKLFAAKTFESAVQIQSEYAKACYEAFIAQATKIGELYSNLFKEIFKPIEAGLTKVQSGQK